MTETDTELKLEDEFDMYVSEVETCEYNKAKIWSEGEDEWRLMAEQER